MIYRDATAEAPTWIWRAGPEDRYVPKALGWRWEKNKRQWVTSDPEAARLAALATSLDPEHLGIVQQDPYSGPCPEGLFQHQVEAVEAWRTQHRLLIADEMGLGKTRTAIACALVADIWPVVIVCPAALKRHWQREWAAVAPEIRCSIAYGDELDTSAEVQIINYELLGRHALKPRLLVIDEAHYCKDSRSLRSKRCQALAEDAEALVLLTGTPILNRPIELYPLLRMLKHPLARSWKRYVERYCAARYTQWGLDVRGASNVQELGKLLGPYVIRRKKADVLDLPPKLYQVISLSLADAPRLAAAVAEERDIIAAAHADYRRVRRKAADALSEVAAAQARLLAEISRARRQTAEAKAPIALAALRDMEPTKAVLWVHHHSVARILRSQLAGENVVVITGETAPSERQHLVDAFNERDSGYAICSIRAAGTGLSLHTSPLACFFELDWTPGAMAQAEDRIHRIGQTATANIIYFVAERSIDEMVAEALVEKTVTIEALDKGIDQLVERYL